MSEYLRTLRYAPQDAAELVGAEEAGTRDGGCVLHTFILAPELRRPKTGSFYTILRGMEIATFLA